MAGSVCLAMRAVTRADVFNYEPQITRSYVRAKPVDW